MTYDRQQRDFDPPALDLIKVAPRPPEKRRIWPFIAIGAGVLVALFGVIVAIARLGDGSIPVVAPEPDKLEQASKECGGPSSGITLADGGKTLIVDGKGVEDYTGADLVDLECVLLRLETPTAARTLMNTTRAFDGRQQTTWGGMSASWTYHPNVGLNLIVTKD